MPDLDYAKVVQRLGLTVGDTEDPDETPDTIWCDAGRVQIVPLNTYVKVADGSPVPWTGGNAVIECDISQDTDPDAPNYYADGAGFLLYRGQPYVWVVDLSSPKVNPYVATGATHHLNYVGVTAQGTAVAFPSVDVRITADGDGVSPGAVNDLTILSPVVPGAATPIFQGPRGTSVASASIDPDTGALIFTLDDPAATELDAGPIPVTEAATTAATDATDAAALATTKATEASTSAGTATTKASEASTSASTATTKAVEASSSAAAAASAKTDAEAARDTLLGQKGAASGIAPLDGTSKVPAANLPGSSTTAQGIVELATTTETTTGTDTARAVTPAGVKAAIDPIRDLSDPTFAGALSASTADAIGTQVPPLIAAEIPQRVADVLASEDLPAEAAAAAVDAALLAADVAPTQSDPDDEFFVKFDDGPKFFRANEAAGITGTLIEGATPAPADGHGLADVDNKDGRTRLTGVLTSGPDIFTKGDSIARAWTPDLAVALASYGYSGRVLNYSVGGENTPTILARTSTGFLATVDGGEIPTSGGVTITLAEDFTGLDADAGDTPRINPLAQAVEGFNPCILIGDDGTRVRGIMTCHDSTGSNPYTFTRLATGSAVPAAYPTPVVTWASQNTMHGIQIFAVGQNDDGTVLNYSKRFDMVQHAIDRMGAGVKRYLVLTAFSGGPSTRSAEETEARRRWGRHAVLTRPWLASYAALAAVGVTPTSTDDTNIAAGQVADSFFTSPDFVHPNATGRQALIRLILNRLIELEWI